MRNDVENAIGSMVSSFPIGWKDIETTFSDIGRTSLSWRRTGRFLRSAILALCSYACLRSHDHAREVIKDEAFTDVCSIQKPVLNHSLLAVNALSDMVSLTSLDDDEKKAIRRFIAQFRRLERMSKKTAINIVPVGTTKILLLIYEPTLAPSGKCPTLTVPATGRFERVFKTLGELPRFAGPERKASTPTDEPRRMVVIQKIKIMFNP